MAAVDFELRDRGDFASGSAGIVGARRVPSGTMMRAGRVGSIFLAAVAVLLLLLPSSDAEARGTVRMSRSTVKESGRAWRLKFTVDYGSKPPSAYVPVIFSFKPTVLYERSLTDDSPKTPITRRMPLQNQTPLNLPMDMSFGDAASGKIWRKTKFSIKLTRAHDFQAGEYRLTVKLARGGTLGRPQVVRLEGKNKVVDRRAMMFHDNSAKAKPKKKAKPKPEAKHEDQDGESPDLSDIPDIPDGQDQPVEKPEAIQKKPGGGCSLGSAQQGGSHLPAWLLLALAFAWGGRGRRLLGRDAL